MKILIVEDNQIIAKFLSTKILSLINVDIDIAKSFDELKEFTKDRDYILSIVDLQLDSDNKPNLELLDFCISKDISTIALSQDDIRGIDEKLNSKNIIDFVFKNRSEFIEKR